MSRLKPFLLKCRNTLPVGIIKIREILKVGISRQEMALPCATHPAIFLGHGAAEVVVLAEMTGDVALLEALQVEEAFG